MISKLSVRPIQEFSDNLQAHEIYLRDRTLGYSMSTALRHAMSLRRDLKAYHGDYIVNT